MDSQHYCPNCGSANFCKLSIVHRNGINSTSANVSYDQDFLGVNNASLTGQSQSLSSAQAAPPTHPFAIFIGLIVAESALYISLGVLGLVLEALRFNLRTLQPFVLPVFLAIGLIMAWGGITSILSYPADRARWNNSYHCQRCDIVFLLEL
jgi:hypothetical protein